MPHNGKMYGFYDPGAGTESYSPPFNPNFLAQLSSQRSARLAAFNRYRQQRDPNGMFRNGFVDALLGTG